MIKGEKKGNVSKLIAGIAILIICLILAFVGYKLVRHYAHKDTVIETEKVVDTRLKKYLDSYECTRDITVAVIDSGINMQDDWNDRVVSGEYNYTNEESMTDPYFHGTVMNKIILDNTDEHVKVLPIKVADSQGSVDVDSVVNGIQCAIERHADIINLSLNMMISDDSKKLEDEITKATDAGIKVVVSAGNNKTDVSNLSPSDMSNVYVVTSIENDNTFSYYSNYGKTVDICAYGTYDCYSGTSYAAAQVSSVFAQLLERDITDIDRVINEYSEAVGTDDEENKEQKYGRGYFGTSMYTASANLNKDDTTNVLNLGYNLMSIDWRSMDTDTLDKYLAGTKAEYVGMFLTSLSDSDMKELEEKSYVIHSQVTKQNFHRADDESMEFEPTDSQQIDYAEYCIDAFNKQKKELNLSSTIDAFAVGTTNTSEFYISDGDSHIICKYDIDGFYNTIQNNSRQFNRDVVYVNNLSVYEMVVKDDGYSELTVPTIINSSITLYSTSVQAHEIRWFNNDTEEEYTQWHEYHPEYIRSNSDNGSIYYGLSIKFKNFKYVYGYHTSENDLTVYKAGTNQPAMSYNHIYDYNWNYNGSYYGDNCARMPIETNFKTGVNCRIYMYYRDTMMSMILYRLTNTTSINPSTNEIQLNGALMYLPGTEWKDGKNWTLAMNNDVASYVFNTVPNNYTFRYETAWGTGNGTMPEDIIHYKEKVKLRYPYTFSYPGHTFDHYSVRRETDNTVYCIDKLWHPYDEVKDQYKFWEWFYPGQTVCCDENWTRSDYNNDDTFTFCAIWRENPTKQKVTYNVTSNGGRWSNGSISNKTISIDRGSKIDLSSQGANKPGFQFVGWSTNRSSTVALSSLSVGQSDITLYALYRKDITVTFIDCKGTKKITKPLYNNSRTVTIDAPAINKYSSWKDVSNVNSIGYSKTKDITKDKANEPEVKSGQKGLQVSENCTYYAIYSADVTLSYELNGGKHTDATNPVTKLIYVNASNLNAVKGFTVQLAECYKDSYDKDGYTHPFLPVVWAENSIDGEKHAMNSKYILTKNTVMYAIWEEDEKEAITYTIHFDGNNGDCVTNVPADIVVKYDQEVNLPEDKPLRTGFTFLDWNTRSSGSGTPYAPGQKVKNLTTINNSVVTLYGHWRQKELILVKAASTAYRNTIIKRTEGDEDWFNSTGHLSIKELRNYPNDKSIQVWNIDKSGRINREK